MCKLVNNAQETELGVDLSLAVTPDGELVRQILSAAGLADDVVLLNDSVQKLKALLLLLNQYCDKFQLVFTTRETELKAKVELASHRICVDGVKISPSAQATHAGVVRSAEGNGPNILAPLSTHRRALYAVLSAGLAKGHSANPAASLSGLASLVLT